MPIEPIPEQRVVALVWLDMIDHVCRRTTAAAQWMGGKILLTRLCPFTVVATLVSRWSLLVEARLALLLKPQCGDATLTTWMSLATMTTDGRSAGCHLITPRPT
ncbi:hypothetical protein [Ochrobactrum soli]|uniref:hypothetical protein n=1 Tax=Ochrobactrum soli TaxID=2448455 RepID=UPI0015E81F2F